MVLTFGGFNSIFPTTDETGQGFGADEKQVILKNTNTYYDTVQSSELNNACNILELQVADSLTPTPLANMEVEIFSDSTGYLNKVNTGSTTGSWITDRYINVGYLDKNYYWTGSSLFVGTTGYYGMKFTVNQKCYLRRYVFINLLDIGTVRLWSNKVGSVLAVGGTDGIFTKPFLLEPGSSYYAVVASSYKSRYSGNASYPQNGSVVNFTAGFDGTNDVTNTIYNIISIETSIATDRIVQSTAMSIPNGVDHLQVFPYKQSGSFNGDISCDVSVNNGSHWIIDTPINSIINNSLKSDNLIVKLNLNAPGSLDLVECKGFGVRYWADE